MWVGVDIGGTKTLVGAAEDPHTILVSRRVATATRADEGLAAVVRLVRECAGDDVDAVGVSCGGPLDLSRGVLVGPRSEHWVDTPVAERLAAALGVRVVLENDANCGALAEYTVGSGRGSRVLLYVTISTGIGTGILVDGVVYRGAHDTEGGCITIDPDGPECPACGGRGHFESLASGLSIEREFGMPASEITDAGVWEEIARRLAVGLTSLMAVVSPDRVVLAGGVSRQYARFSAALQRHLEAMRQPYPLAPVVRATHVDTAPLRGAVLVAAGAAPAHRRHASP